MKPGSVLVDLAAETGGNIEVTRPGEIYTYKVSSLRMHMRECANQHLRCYRT
jgi:alanine dehydrogenase